MTAQDEPEDFLPVFNSNPDYLRASGGKHAYDHGDVAAYLYTATSQEHGRCLTIRRREDGILIGTAALLVPHSDGHPWIGLLIIDGDSQEQGLGREAAMSIEASLVDEGWQNVRLGVLKSNERALLFWRSCGYAVIVEKANTSGSPCWVLGKPLSGSDTPTRRPSDGDT